MNRKIINIRLLLLTRPQTGVCRPIRLFFRTIFLRRSDIDCFYLSVQQPPLGLSFLYPSFPKLYLKEKSLCFAFLLLVPFLSPDFRLSSAFPLIHLVLPPPPYPSILLDPLPFLLLVSLPRPLSNMPTCFLSLIAWLLPANGDVKSSQPAVARRALRFGSKEVEKGKRSLEWSLRAHVSSGERLPGSSFGWAKR